MCLKYLALLNNGEENFKLKKPNLENLAERKSQGELSHPLAHHMNAFNSQGCTSLKSGEWSSSQSSPMGGGQSTT